MDTLWREIRYTFRRLARSPAVSFAAVASLLFRVRTEDPVTFSAIPLFLLVVSLLAYALPALRASRADPVEGLRSE